MADLIQSFNEALALAKIIYGGVLPNVINLKTGPLHESLTRTSKNIVGGEKVVKAAPWGMLGGVGAFSDTTGVLPVASKQDIIKFESTVKNLAGRFVLTHKAMLMLNSDKAAFMSVLEQNMTALQESCKFDYGRQLYLDGSGANTVCDVTTAALTVVVASTQYLTEGMLVDIAPTATGVNIANGTARKIAAILSDTTFLLSGTAVVTTDATMSVYNQGAYHLEITGVGAVMAQTGTIYGLDRATYPKLKAKLWSAVGALDDTKIMKAIIDRAVLGGNVDLLVAHPLVYAAYGDFLSSTKQNVNTTTLVGGWDALKVGNKNLVYDRFAAPQTIRGFVTGEWYEHSAQDWAFAAESERTTNTVNYETLMLKYAEVICDAPHHSFTMEGITV